MNKILMVVLLLFILTGVIATKRNTYKSDNVNQSNNVYDNNNQYMKSMIQNPINNIQIEDFQKTTCPDLINGLGFDCYKCIK